jgi:alpha-tubulin suppressor-like RCC1 family protein
MSRLTRAITGTAGTLWIVIAGWGALGCRADDIAEPTEPSAADPKPALATSTTALTYRQVSAGSFHSCAVTTDDRAYCWGRSALGRGDPDESLTPVAVGGGLLFRTVSAGGNYTCGLTTAGRAYCWGGNSSGELGDGTTNESSLPVRVQGGLRFRHLETGEYHTCGITDPDWKLYCWGDNRFGQLGDGTKVMRTTPVAVLGGLVFRQLSPGGYHTCALTATYQAYCWGNNQFGQLGSGNLFIPLRTRPFLVAGGRSFRQVQGGRYHTCAVTTNSRAFCWGSGEQGQIGHGIASLVNFRPVAVAGGLSFLRVTAGSFHSCGEATDHRPYCWGDNVYGELGDGSTIQRLTPVRVMGVPTLGGMSASTGGGLHTCAKRGDGKAYCWGAGFAGELGDGTTDEHHVPVAVVDPT